MASEGLIAEDPILPVALGIDEALIEPVENALKGLWLWRQML